MTADTELLERRKHVLRGLRLYYDAPFHPVRGEGVWLYDAAGTPWLDAYNNVVPLGHGAGGSYGIVCIWIQIWTLPQS